ncbi:MAG TPA: amidase family protein, partial [Anaerolineales bacterium]|nr:amidase family protein [Anaerolineales bacterium]
STLREALGRQAAFRQAITEIMEAEAVDLWISPAAMGAAPRGLESTGDPIMNLPWTQAGMPALTLPAAVDAQNLPIGIQLAARPDADEALLAWADPIQMILRESEGAAPPLEARFG